MRNLQSRIDRLEAEAGARPQDDVGRIWPRGTWVHRVLQEIGESEDEARARYERETGYIIGQHDGILLRSCLNWRDGRPMTEEEIAVMKRNPSYKPLANFAPPFRSL